MNTTVKLAALLAAVAGGTFVASAAHASTATDTFDVSMTITAACSVTAGSASDIDLGTVASTATDLGDSSNITVKCSNTVPYYVGMAPSSGATSGAGSLSPSGSSPDTVPYQLRSSAGTSGAVWGNTATTTAVGNGVAGTGNGSDQTLTAYVTAPSANYAPDTYSDTVTVTVNY
ncbi:MAG: spore coat protein U domain-containing protein [Alteraurantiacibacter sp.]